MTPPKPAPGRSHATDSAAATSLLSVVTILAGCGSLFLSLIFAMAGDSCTSSPCGGDGVLGAAYLITWGGAGTAMWLTFSGITKASRAGRATWPWPAAGLALVIGTFIAGLLLANSLIGHH
jgi:hypothetical protein